MSGFVLDTPDQIQAFALLQVWHKLKMEVEHPGGPTWRYSPAMQARTILTQQYGKADPGRTKKKVFTAYTELLVELGLK